MGITASPNLLGRLSETMCTPDLRVQSITQHWSSTSILGRTKTKEVPNLPVPFIINLRTMEATKAELHGVSPSSQVPIKDPAEGSAEVTRQ